MTYLNLLLAGDKLGAVDPMDIIAAYTALGDTKAALTALQKAVDAKDPDAIDFNVEPLLANLHSFPQYRALVKQAALDTTTN
jgi:hypothetical protein